MLVHLHGFPVNNVPKKNPANGCKSKAARMATYNSGRLKVASIVLVAQVDA